MKKLLLAALLLLLGGFLPAAAQDEEEPVQIQMPFNVEMGKPIKVKLKYTMQQGPASMTAIETVELTPLKAEGDQVIYRAKSVESDLLDLQGMPPLIGDVVMQVAEASKGLTYEYAADGTGYPLELTETKEIKKLMKKARKALKKWAKEFSKANDLDKQQRKQVIALTEQSLLEAFPEEEEALNRTVLESGQLVFYPTGRWLYRDYYTEIKTSRYFEPGEAYFHTIDSWQLVSYDEAKGEAVVQFDQYLNDDEYQGFLGRYKNMLMEQYGESEEDSINELVEKYRQMQMTRKGEYVIDLTSGLPKSGTVRSEQTFDGNTEVETIEFTMGY